ncbi:SDR family oxidoreductase [Aeromicrobium sp. Leaf245]|uniref:SDR family NAD(P)-dependent oxidoreductase n=1 Tax=Aeromicrobium sp. Leaf245 TaxID=1736306 RepID=UPI0006FE1954|nr:SDR family NAD(P)-dependent oxidoreductase [Aeromicrobium sp. Leaf245]KQO41778.1 short-chain dehydrogenase [Aeromicrobium sp. Leaf245]
MELTDVRALVVGATGALGGGIARALHEAGASLAVTGRDADRLAAIGEELDAPTFVLDVVDVERAAATVRQAVDALGGLDVLVVATGVPAFGPAVDADPVVVEELFAVNTLGATGVVRAALPHLDGGVAVVLSAILADAPTAGMADYSAAKTALSAWLTVARREHRRSTRIVDVRPPHLDTDLASHALAGDPPRLPEPLPATDVVDAVLRAIDDDKATEVVWDRRDGLVVR